MLTVTTTGNWRHYWGVMPLPDDADALGLVRRDSGETGALIRLASGVYVQGNAGGIRNLPQDEVRDLLARSATAAALGSISTPKKAAASRENGKRGGRPPKQPVTEK